METDKIIERINKKGVGSGHFQGTDLSGEEKIFLSTYRPERSLIAYGTLAPNAPNHSVVEHIRGSWQPGTVRGRLIKKGWGADKGYNAFMHTSAEVQEEIKVWVLLSDELNANWQMLDDFEGIGYKRILASYKLEDGSNGVGNIYAINEDEI